MNILGEPGPADDADNEILCLQALKNAAAGDWRAAAWWLEHHPSTREDWSDAGYERRAERRTIQQMVDVIESLGYSPQERQRIYLAMRAAGVGMRDAENAAAREAREAEEAP